VILYGISPLPKEDQMLGKEKSSKIRDESVVSYGRAVSSEENTVIGKQITIEGTVRGKEDLLVEGSVKGSIELAGNHLTVGLNGQVEADIQAENVTIRGHVMGNVDALAKVSITKEADFNGEIHAKSISIEDGAYLKAVIELEKEPEMKSIRPVKLDDKAASNTTQKSAILTAEADKAK
jgi:cytoskeletal protein CcmA (bactofilin family)